MRNLANNHHDLRHFIGVEREHHFERVEFTYENIYDNVSSLSDKMLKELNERIVKFGNCLIFKKKEGVSWPLKMDTVGRPDYVVEANVHFPTDYNLLYDCIRKCCHTLSISKKAIHP